MDAVIIEVLVGIGSSGRYSSRLEWCSYLGGRALSASFFYTVSGRGLTGTATVAQYHPLGLEDGTILVVCPIPLGLPSKQNVPDSWRPLKNIHDEKTILFLYVLLASVLAISQPGWNWPADEGLKNQALEKQACYQVLMAYNLACSSVILSCSSVILSRISVILAYIPIILSELATTQKYT